MEISQGNSLYSYIKGTKMSFFFFFFYLQMLENKRVEQVLPGWVGTSGRGRRWRKGVGG
jgi:hypothetical protein